jgi:hypothetical protein
MHLEEVNSRLAVLERRALIPIGGLHITIDPTNPSITLGYGVWSAFATGRVLVGVDVSDTDFDTVMETGGSKTATF